MNDQVYVTASEIGDYIYCPRSWWLKQAGVREITPQMVKGRLMHDLLAVSSDSIGIRKIIIYILIVLIILMFLVLIVSNLFVGT